MIKYFMRSFLGKSPAFCPTASNRPRGGAEAAAPTASDQYSIRPIRKKCPRDVKIRPAGIFGGMASAAQRAIGERDALLYDHDKPVDLD